MMAFEMPDTRNAEDKQNEIGYHWLRRIRILKRNYFHTDRIARRGQAALMIFKAPCPLQPCLCVTSVEVKSSLCMIIYALTAQACRYLECYGMWLWVNLIVYTCENGHISDRANMTDDGCSRYAIVSNIHTWIDDRCASRPLMGESIIVYKINWQVEHTCLRTYKSEIAY